MRRSDFYINLLLLLLAVALVAICARSIATEAQSSHKQTTTEHASQK
ncbi:MAG: hypothetical protein IJV45_09895 [Prevotella sp.]|nr:hypothetical protein [Prevotella sp.]